MANDRNRNYDFPSSSYDRDRQDYGRDYGSGRDYTYSSARSYEAAGEFGGRDDRDRGYGRDDRNFRGGGTGYGGGNYGSSYGARNDSDRSDYGSRGDYYSRGSYGQQNFGGDRGGNWDRGGNTGRDSSYHGSYASDGRRFTETGDRGDYGGQDRGRQGGDRGYGRAPQGYDYQDRGFFARAGDEVRSWFGDDDAERRREADQRYDERLGGYGASNYGRDSDYHNWRRTQIDALDRDYHEYRQENASKFENEFGSWRTNRQTQRSSLSNVKEHMEVVGSDGAHVGTVDKVRGDRILLTKNDADAGGRHHSIPSNWLTSVDDKVTINKTAEDAKKRWQDEENAGALFGDRSDDKGEHAGRTDLNRSFSGTY